MKSQEWVLEILGQNQTFWRENEPLTANIFESGPMPTRRGQ